MAYGLVLLASSAGPASAQQPQAQGPSDDPFEQPPPRDPDDTPFLPAPNNQLGQWSVGRERSSVRGFDDDHRLQLTLVPSYAAMHLPFIGRGPKPYRGAGVALELDLRIVRWLFVRVAASHTLHPVPEQQSSDDTGELTLLAHRGLLQATNTGLSLVYALDIGRFVPRVDVGAGLLFVRSPAWAQPGQWGGPCATGNVCDLGLRCSAANFCEPAPFPEVHAGIALDVLLGERWVAGLHVRYHALLQALSQIPLYLSAGVRLGVRW